MPAYKDKKTGRWRYRFALHGVRYGGTTPLGHNAKKLAEQLEKGHIERLVSNTYDGVMPLVREFGVRFLAYQQPRTKPLTRASQRRAIAQVDLLFGSMRLDQVGKREVDLATTTWKTSAGLGASSVNARLATFQRMLSVASSWGIITRVPAFEYLPVAKKAPRFLSPAEATSLLAACGPTWFAMVLIGMRTGLRIGELRGLRWEDLDLKRGVVRVSRTDPGRGGWDATAPKSNNERTVPLSPEAIAALRAWGPSKGLVWPSTCRDRKAQGLGRPRSENTCCRVMTATVLRAGLEDVTWHTLRHTFASWLVQRGIPIRVVQQYLGHASITMTEVYAHLAPDFGHTSIGLLDAPVLEPASQGATNALPPGEEEPSNPGPVPSGEG